MSVTMARTAFESTAFERATDAGPPPPAPSPASLPRDRARTSASSGLVWVAADAVSLTGAILLAELTSASRIPATPVHWLIAFAMLVLALLHTQGMHRPPLDLRILDDNRAVVTATALATAIAISARVVLTDSSFVAAQSARTWVFATVAIATFRIALLVSERESRRAGLSGQPTLIFGAGNVGRLVATRLCEHPEIGLRPVGFLDEEAPQSCDEIARPLLGDSSDLESLVQEHAVGHVILTSSTAPDEVMVEVLKRCERLGVRTSLVPRLYEQTSDQLTVVRLGGVPLVSSRSPDPTGWAFALKYAVDRCAAVAALLLLAPLMGALAVAVWISSGRPILYRQQRIGRDGRPFDMLKFRSMRPAPDAPTTGVAIAADVAPGGVEGVDRRTRIGTIMRRTSLDELPQLLNVVKGDMSFIGPRPERPEFVELFERTIHRYPERHRVKTGITGWAQVCGLRGKTSISDRIEWDNYYIENWSFWFDFRVLLLTLVAVARPGKVE